MFAYIHIKMSSSIYSRLKINSRIKKAPNSSLKLESIQKPKSISLEKTFVKINYTPLEPILSPPK
jgi:hypothetical protein